ncbi:hypothetical protein [Actinoplanes sichuanensis]|uniref:Uncharacterized protein n=1 Tax=Actinoplanes sichuanensis TaxID=512349 RepID=A0ABW4APQ7_9ACTN|nr:hypothetical protein [Actinoplanes sichuanensis]
MSARARHFLHTRSRRGPWISGAGFGSEQVARFQERYGGLTYPVLGGNDMEYGVDGDPSFHDTPLGPAFLGILDGDWTWSLSVLTDGSTAMGPGSWPYRVIDRSVEQRIERHALVVEVRGRPHRTFECRTPPGVQPIVEDSMLPPAAPEASGPAELWWSGDDVAVQATLSAWPPGGDSWTIRYFARHPMRVTAANDTVRAAVFHETVPAVWCSLCSRDVAPGATCMR